jgi:putative MATE family efflux protein
MITVLGLIFTPSVLKLTNTPDAVFEDAKLYTMVYFAGGIALVIYNVGSGIMRALGDSKRPMIYLMICCIVNIVLDLFCIVVLKMGLAGAALATTASQIVSAVLVTIHLMRLDSEAKLHLKRIRFDRTILGEILKIGVPSGLQSTMYSVSNLIIQAGINSFGSVTAAAWTAHDRMCSINWMVVSAFGVAITTFVGQNFGAQKYDRVGLGVRHGGTIASLTSAVITVILLFASPILFGFFTETPALIDLATRMIRVMAFGYICMSLTQVLGGIMRGCGETVTPMWVSIIQTIALRVPIAYLLAYLTRSPEFPHGNPIALFGSLMISWTIGMIISIVVFKTGKWRKKIPDIDASHL